MISTAADVARRQRHGRGRPRAPAARIFAVVFGSYFLSLPVHAGGMLIVNLHAVHSDVALAGLRIARDYAGKSDEAARVLRPALEDGKPSSEKLSRRMTSLHGPVETVLGKNFPISASMGSIFTLSRKPCGDFTSMNWRMRSATSSS